MKNEALERPKITDFTPSGMTLSEIHKTYIYSIELWNYIQALDAYCNELESALCEGKPDSDTSGGLHLADVTAMLPTKSDMENKVTDARLNQVNEHQKFIEGYELGNHHCYNWMKRIISLFGN